MKKIACLFPIYAIGEFHEFRKSAWVEQDKFTSEISDVFNLVMNTTEEQNNEILTLIPKTSNILFSVEPHCSLHARYILAKYVKELGYEYVYLNDDDERLGYANFKEFIEDSELTLSSIEEILENAIIAFRVNKQIPVTRCIEKKVHVGATADYGDFISSPNFYKLRNGKYYQPDARYCRTQRGYLLKTEDFIWIVENSVESLKQLDNYTSHYYNFEDSLIPYIAYHCLNKHMRFIRPHIDNFITTTGGGNAGSTVWSNSSIQGRLNNMPDEERDEYAQRLHDKFDNSIKGKDVSEFIFKIIEGEI